jgi:hypothetical protein
MIHRDPPDPFRRNLVAFSSVVLGAALFLLSITGPLSPGMNLALRLAAIVFGLGGFFFILFLARRRDRP